jgi:hypothetical protein
MDVNALSGGTTSPFGSSVTGLAAFELSYGLGSTPFVLTSNTGANTIIVQTGAAGGGTQNQTVCNGCSTTTPTPTVPGTTPSVNGVTRRFWQQIQ